VIVSDHGMEPRTADLPIDPRRDERTAPVVDDLLADCGAAWVRPRGDPLACSLALDRLPGIGGTRIVAPDRVLALAQPGQVFAGTDLPAAGVHGSSSTRATTAIVAGGRRNLGPMERLARSAYVTGDEWAPFVSEALGFGGAPSGNGARHGAEVPRRVLRVPPAT
jgi:hypothetical protein